jgi:hypothetical protein
MAEVKKGKTALLAHPTQKLERNQGPGSEYRHSSRDGISESAQNGRYVAVAPPPPLAYHIAPSTAVSPQGPRSLPPSTPPPVDAFIPTQVTPQKQAHALSDENPDKGTSRSSQHFTKSSPRTHSGDAQNGIEPVSRELQSSVSSEKEQSDIKKSNVDINGQPPKVNIPFSDDRKLQPPPPPPPAGDIRLYSPQNNNPGLSIQPDPPARLENRKIVNLPIPRSVLKKKGGQIFQRQRSAEPKTVEITAEDLLQPHLTLRERAPTPPMKKQVKFVEPEPEKPPIVIDPYLTAWQRKRIKDTILARRQVNILRNEAEIERRNFSSTRGLLNNDLNDLLSFEPDLLSILHHDGPQKERDNLVHEFEKNWAKFRETANIILKQHSMYDRVTQKMSTVEISLMSLDNRVREKDEQRLDEAAPVAPGADNSNEDDAISDDSNESPASAHSDSTGLTPSLVREYYDKIGEVLLTKDFIHNLDTEHLQTVRVIQSQRDRGIEPDVSETRIFEEYFNDRLELLTYYIRNKEDVYTLRGLCRDNEYQVEEPNLPPEGPDMDQSIRPRRTVRVLLNHDYLLNESNIMAGPMASINIHNLVRPLGHSIVKWMKEIEVDLGPHKGWGEDSNFTMASETVESIPSVPPGTIGVFDLDEEERTQKGQISNSDKDDVSFQPDKISRRCSDPNLRTKELDEFTNVRKLVTVRRALSETS